MTQSPVYSESLDEAERAEGGGGHRGGFGGDGFDHHMRAAALQSVDQAARDLSVALCRAVPERVRVRVREQKPARERAARARARRVTGQQRVRVQVFINRLGSRRRRSDAYGPARVALEEVLQTLSAGARLLPEGRGELPLAHRDLPRRVQTRTRFIRGELGERRVAASARRPLGAAVREALELLLQVFAVVHGAPAGRGSIQRRLDVARRQIDEVQERLHLAVGARHRALSHLSSTSSVQYSPDLRFWSKPAVRIIAQAL